MSLENELKYLASLWKAQAMGLVRPSLLYCSGMGLLSAWKWKRPASR